MHTILKIPFDKCVVEKERRGAALAPNQIEKEYCNIFEAPKVKWVSVPISDDFEKNVESIGKSFLKNKPLASVGGDHSVSYGVMKTFSKLNKNACLLFFDAHFDCQDYFLPPTHEDVLKAVVKEGFFKAENIFVIGVRNFTRKEIDFIKKNKIKYSLAENFSFKEIINFANKYDKIYFNLDIDAIDPSFAPGTGWPEPLGLHPKDIMNFILQLKSKIKFLDIVEVCPIRDINNITSKLAAKFLAKFLS
jgi:agmatinase